jgi:hypothetical protein
MYRGSRLTKADRLATRDTDVVDRWESRANGLQEPDPLIEWHAVVRSDVQLLSDPHEDGVCPLAR